MTKRTRVRVARIAVGAVVAAGASLMVTGVAQADEDPICDIVVAPECAGEPGGEGPEDGEPGGGVPEGGEPGGEEPGGEGPEDGEPGGGVPEDGEPGGEGPEGGEPGGGEPGGEGPGGGEPGGEGPGGEGLEGGEPGGGEPGGEGPEGGEPGGEFDEGERAQGAESGGLTDASVPQEGFAVLTDTGDGPTTSAQGGGGELAETGAAETLFLVIGAATMIAGGVGLHVLPRRMGGRSGATA